MAVGELLLLLLGLLVSAHCEVRARDPGGEEDQDQDRDRDRDWDQLGAGGSVGLQRLHPGDSAPPGEGGTHPARTGNWCTFVHRRLVSMAVAHGTEEHTIKSQSLCPSGTPDCQLVLYKLSTRPVYREQQRILTALLWRCCPGHGGHNCEDSVTDAHMDPDSSSLIGGTEAGERRIPGLTPPSSGAQAQIQQRRDPNQVQNDHQASASTLHITAHSDNRHATPTGNAREEQHIGHTHHTQHPDQVNNTHPTANKYEHAPPPQEQHLPGLDSVDAVSVSFPAPPPVLPDPRMMELVISQLQPLLQGFNRSLERLSQQVEHLSQDVAQLKSVQQGAGQGPGAGLQLGGPELDQGVEERFDAKLDEVFQHVEEVRRHVESQRADMEARLHSQHAMLLYNLTSFKTDIDVKLKRNQKLLQVSLQNMNSSLVDLKLDQEQMSQDLQRSLSPPPPVDTSALWDAIQRLDNTVVNNTVKVSELQEDLEVTLGDVEQLRQSSVDLQQNIVQTGRDSQVQFMETVLEVEAAKVAVLSQLSELAGNTSERFQEMDVDVDYLYITHYKLSNASGDCGCKTLRDTVTRLERGVANVTELANQNRLALDENSEGGAGQWGGADDWEPAGETLRQVKESLAFEQSRTRTLSHNLTQLSDSLAAGLADFSGLQEADRRLREEMRHLSGSFASLLKDAIRHSDVLELLLGEEVLEFLEWPVQDQEAHSIPALKELLRNIQQKITTIQQDTGSREETPAADQPSSSSSSSSWFPGGLRRSSDGVPVREPQLLHPDTWRQDYRGDGGDLWNLEKTVEELGVKVRRMEEKPCSVACDSSSVSQQGAPGGTEAKLQAELTWLKRVLEEHLRTFKNIFSNADMLERSHASLELDQVWQLLRSKDEKKDRKRGAGGKEGSSRRGSQRNKRGTSGFSPVLSNLSENSPLFLSGSPRSVQSGGILWFDWSLNPDVVQSDPSTFTAPVGGTYLFVLTLELRPGLARVGLRRRKGGALATLHCSQVKEAGPITGLGLLPLSKGEELQVELREGAWVESRNNVLAVLLLRPAT
ncbi:multimerin-2a [Genypterus blacodes]|uniref:multimerin-2a n=1 Tax=Genypterus blacodes TaxID=154954 RepID=UPI003F76D011